MYYKFLWPSTVFVMILSSSSLHSCYNIHWYVMWSLTFSKAQFVCLTCRLLEFLFRKLIFRTKQDLWSHFICWLTPLLDNGKVIILIHARSLIYQVWLCNLCVVFPVSFSKSRSWFLMSLLGRFDQRSVSTLWGYCL